MATQNKSLPENELKALVSLLDEEDTDTYHNIAEKLKEVLIVEPHRVEAMIPSLDIPTCRRLMGILEEARWEKLETSFWQLKRSAERDFDLQEGMYLLSTFQYPKLKRAEIQQPLDELAESIQHALARNDRLIDVIKIVSNHLFVVKGFRGNTANFYDPDNCYFNRVLERKLGNPYTLSVLYLLVGKRLALPVTGVRMPGHFIVQSQVPSQKFYIDPFHKGRILSVADCQRILANRGLRFDRHHLKPVSNWTILARIMNNLIHVYTERGDKRKSGRLSRYLRIFQEEENL